MTNQKLTLALLGVATLFSCSSTPSRPMASSELNPAGRGEVKARTDHNQNTALQVEVNHLAPAKKISSSATTYVVWVSPSSDPRHVQNIGALEVDDSLSGKLETVTPFRSFDLFVTAEQTPTAIYPSAEKMFSTRVTTG